MTAKMTIDDLFEKDEQVEAARLVRLQRWEGWLRVALGLAIACLLFTPDLLRGPDDALHFVLTFALWLLPIGFSLFLLFWPGWRSVPVSRRRPCIILSLAVSVVAFSVLPAYALLNYASPGSVLVLFSLVALAALALVGLNIHWKATDRDGELFV